MQCEYIYNRGQFKGQQCQVIPKGDSFCYKHNSKRKEYNQQYRTNNKDQIDIYKKQYRIVNRDQRKAYNKQYNAINWDKALLRTCRKHDKVHGREFSLNEDWIQKMLYAQYNLCYICGDEMLLINGTRNPKQISVNRVDNSKGHIKGNVILTCFHCNMLQNSKHLSELHDLDDVLHPDTIDELM